MESIFFRFEDNSPRNVDFPQAWSVSTLGATCPERRCSGCRRPLPTRYKGEVYAKVEDGSQWPDALGSRFRPFFSERVIGALSKAAISGFDAQPVVITEVNSPVLHGQPPPRYYYLNINGRIDVDLDALGIRYDGQCGTCGLLFSLETAPTLPKRFVPLDETWDGSHIFVARNYGSYPVFCTMEVLLLAREHRWTNFRFEPMDISHEDSVRWAGIDYLGKKWPPQWYPPPASAGKTLQEWLAEYDNPDPERSYAAILALVELGPLAVPPFAERLRAQTGSEQLQTARMLHAMRRRGAKLPEDVDAEVTRLLGPL